MVANGGISDFQTARLRIEAWCAWQERSISEVKNKLQSWGLGHDQIEKMLTHLQNNRFLDEARFAEAYTMGKLRIKHWGRIKIRMHLRQKQVPEILIRQVFESMEDDEYMAVLDQLIQRKRQSLKSGLPDWQKRGKLVQYLQSKGFEYDLISDRLKEVGIRDEEE